MSLSSYCLIKISSNVHGTTLVHQLQPYVAMYTRVQQKSTVFCENQLAIWNLQ